MRVCFVHRSFPGQFGKIAEHLAGNPSNRCTFVSECPATSDASVEWIQYRRRGGATKHTPYCARPFENAIAHAQGVYDALMVKAIQPDLIVGHSGFGSTLFLRELYDCPVINYFEYFYRSKHSDIDFHPDFPPLELDRLRARARNAMILLDLDNCDVGYSPTNWQRAGFPAEYQGKLRTIFDGVDTNFWKPAPQTSRQIGDRSFPADVRIVTYAARGMEPMRGFDVFMKVARRLCDLRRDVVFLIAGHEGEFYGGDRKVTGQTSFKKWMLSQDNYDLSRFVFLDFLDPTNLAKLFNISDLHIYLTMPFVLSWSVMNALACGATVLGSDTGPVQEMIEHERNGLLKDFFDVDGLVETANRVLNDPGAFRFLGLEAVRRIRENYSLDVCLPRIVEFYEMVVGQREASGDGGKSCHR